MSLPTARDGVVTERTRSLLVTGGAGFIGAHFVHHWVAAHPADRVVVLDALTYAGRRALLAPLETRGAITFVHGDILDGALVARLLAEHGVDTVVHFAAESHVDRSIADPMAFVRTNVLGTQVLLDACRAAWRVDGVWRDGVRFHHVSTDEVFGALGPADPPFTEATPYAPNSPYSASKAGSDLLVRAALHTHGLPATVSWCSNNYGPWQFAEKLIPLMVTHALRGKPLPVYGDGQQVRDWLHVRDHCAAIEAIVLGDVAGEGFVIGGRAEVVNLALVRQLCALVDEAFAADPGLAARFPDCPAARGARCDTLVTFVTDRPGHDRRYAIDPARIAARLGFRPQHTLESGLRETVRWYVHES
jgi:dTDP-glucose 4,6-dehydratase